jgi:prepilin-type N-terminal cleavage/methylation domain-containing protein
MNKGFTLIESLTVIAILALMTSFLILYNRTGERQIVLLREKANLISTVLKAKNLALGGFIREPLGEVVCGYGVHFEDDKYFIYRDLAVDCNASDMRYTADNPKELFGDIIEILPVVSLKIDEVSDILFAPPTPDVFFDGSEALLEKNIILSDIDNTTEVVININNAGQISTQ